MDWWSLYISALQD